MTKQRLELTWIGKDVRPKLEPRILLEAPEKSYHAPARVTDKDIFDNMLIHGDNLLALKALEQEYTGKVKCIYIDPPFNTQQAFEHYDDGIEHSLWLSLIDQRLRILYNLLSDDGTIFIHIDDNELGYLIVLLDEILGRKNRVSVVTFKQGSATGHKAINPGVVTTSNFILMYTKNKSVWNPNKIFTERKDRDKRYSQFITNYSSGHNHWGIVTLMSAFSEYKGIEEKHIKKTLGNKFEDEINCFVINNANKVVQLVRPDYNAVSGDARKIIDLSKKDKNHIFLLKRKAYSDMYFSGGQRILFYSDKLKTIDGACVAGEPLTTIWDDILSNNLHNEGFVEFPKNKKPEGLIKRCIELASNPGDLVLDSFLGSGTTAAVAHKMGRRWIGIELGDHCYTHCIPRLQKVINGEDQGGITKAVNWQGGGGFRFYELGPSLIKQDKWGNAIINPEFNPEMLAEALCKIAGFTYAPDKDVFWMQGRGNETDFLYATTQFLDAAQLISLNEEVGEGRSLVVYCSAFRVPEGGMGQLTHLTVRKIPKSVLTACEWNKDDYSLAVQNLPQAEPRPNSGDDAKAGQDAANGPTTKKRKAKNAGQPSLFDLNSAKEGDA